VQTIGKPIVAPVRSFKSTVASVAAHILALLLIVGALHHNKSWVAPYRLPGSTLGHNFVVAYLPDRAPDQAAMAKAKADPKPTAPKSLLPTLAKPKAANTTAPSTTTTASPQPDSTTGADALGSGNITIALVSFFPPPHPDLTVLPHGTRGDVILHVVIDTDGKISDLKKLSGLGYGIDENVIATVEQWTFHPALQNGRPVASEQELHFHYERS
jgi:periplasmic protein TonB